MVIAGMNLGGDWGYSKPPGDKARWEPRAVRLNNHPRTYADT
ncbi:MAG: hypothetical protein QW168_01075 [Sulfolobales archaeon]